MPNPDPGYTRRQAERERRYTDAITDSDTSHLTAAAITNCRLCDDDGYRSHAVCDHIDHSAAATRGLAKCREALAKTAESHADAQEVASAVNPTPEGF